MTDKPKCTIEEARKIAADFDARERGGLASETDQSSGIQMKAQAFDPSVLTYDPKNVEQDEEVRKQAEKARKEEEKADKA